MWFSRRNSTFHLFHELPLDLLWVVFHYLGPIDELRNCDKRLFCAARVRPAFDLDRQCYFLASPTSWFKSRLPVMYNFHHCRHLSFDLKLTGNELNPLRAVFRLPHLKTLLLTLKRAPPLRNTLSELLIFALSGATTEQLPLESFKMVLVPHFNVELNKKAVELLGARVASSITFEGYFHLPLDLLWKLPLHVMYSGICMHNSREETRNMMELIDESTKYLTKTLCFTSEFPDRVLFSHFPNLVNIIFNSGYSPIEAIEYLSFASRQKALQSLVWGAEYQNLPDPHQFLQFKQPLTQLKLRGVGRLEDFQTILMHFAPHLVILSAPLFDDDSDLIWTMEFIQQFATKNNQQLTHLEFYQHKYEELRPIILNLDALRLAFPRLVLFSRGPHAENTQWDRATQPKEVLQWKKQWKVADERAASVLIQSTFEQPIIKASKSDSDATN